MTLTCRDCDATTPSYRAARADGWARSAPTEFRCPDCRTERLDGPVVAIGVRIPRDLVDLIDETGRPRAEVVRHALAEYLSLA